MTTPVKWPNGARCAIMMTFDLDGESPWIQRDPALADRYLHMSLGSYGPKTGMPRILDLLDRYDIKTCIFIPGWIVEHYPALCEEIVRRATRSVSTAISTSGPHPSRDARRKRRYS
jgi:hypothetical protein